MLLNGIALPALLLLVQCFWGAPAPPAPEVLDRINELSDSEQELSDSSSDGRA